MLVQFPLNMLRVKFFKEYRPFRVLHFVTFRCNLRCKYCGIWKTKIRELDKEKIEELMLYFRKKGVVFWTFTGGEPLVRSDIGKLVDFATKLFPLVSLTTNGILLKDRFDEIKNVDYITVSLDGPEEVNDKIRGKGVFRKAMEGIKEVRKHNKKVVINTVLSKENLKNNLAGLKEIVRLSLKLGCKFNFNVMYSDQFNKGYVSDERQPLSTLFPSKKEFENAIKFIMNLKERLGDFIQPSLQTIKHMSTSHKWKLCYAGKAFVDLFPDGRILPCIFKEKFASKNSAPTFPLFYNCRCVSECYSELNAFMNFDINSLFTSLKKVWKG